VPDPLDAGSLTGEVAVKSASGVNSSLDAEVSAGTAIAVTGVTSVSAVVPSISDAQQVSLFATAVGVTTTPPPSRTVSVSSASLQTSAGSTVSVTVPTVTISGSTSASLSATSVGVQRNAPTGSPDASLSAANVFGSTASFSAANTTHPDYSNSQLTFTYDPDLNSPIPPDFITNGESVQYDYSNVAFRYNQGETVTVEVVVEDPNGNTDTATDTCSVGTV